MSHAASVIDNWQTDVELPHDLVCALRREIGSAPPPGTVEQISTRLSRRPPLLFRREVVFCQKVDWHKDPIANALFLVLINDGHLLDGSYGGITSEHQAAGAAFRMDLRRFHRCRCLLPRSSGKLWAALAIDFAGPPEEESDRHAAELIFRNELDLLAAELQRMISGTS